MYADYADYEKVRVAIKQTRECAPCVGNFVPKGPLSCEAPLLKKKALT